MLRLLSPEDWTVPPNQYCTFSSFYLKVYFSTGVTNIIANLTPERLAAVVEEGYMGREVIVEIPKFTVERSLPLREVSGCHNLFYLLVISFWNVLSARTYKDLSVSRAVIHCGRILRL